MTGEDRGSRPAILRVVRTAVVFVATAVTVAYASSAAGSPHDSVAIRPGVGIGPINLGMTGHQVRRALGRPRTVVARRVFRGVPYTELEFGLGTWSVGLLGRKGNRRVVLIGTALSRHRTPEGLGIGSTDTELWRRLRGMRDRICGFASIHWYYRRGMTETVFHPAKTEAVVVFVDVRRTPVLGCSF